MKRIYASAIGLDQGTELLFSDFENGGDMWDGEGSRERRVAIKFSESFKDIPNVLVTLEMFDGHSTTNQRYHISTENITLDGFDIIFRTWGDTRVARVRASWMAIGGVDAEDNWIEVDY